MTFTQVPLLPRIDFAAGGNSHYEYDADSKRVSQRTEEGFRQFVYRGPDMLALQMERDESEETVAQYTIGAGLEVFRLSGHFVDRGNDPVHARYRPARLPSTCSKRAGSLLELMLVSSGHGDDRPPVSSGAWVRKWPTYAVVVLVGGLLFAQIMSWISGPSVRCSPDKVASCRDHLAELYAALETYHADHGAWPASLSSLVPTYAASSEAVVCPADPRPPYQLVSSDGFRVVCENHEMIIRYQQPILFRELHIHVAEHLVLESTGEFSIVGGPRWTETVPAWKIRK